jgi:hypothetical protein
MPLDESKNKGQHLFEFKMDAYTVDSIPLNRLAEYLTDLATVLGEYKSVHFAGLERGSVRAQFAIEHEAEPKVRNRLRLLTSDDGPADAINAIGRINRRLASDNASGKLLDPNANCIIPFPGKENAQPEIGPVKQLGTIDGIPIRIGGKGSSVPVHLKDMEGVVHICGAKTDMAREIAKHMFSNPVRAEGTGSWTRTMDGEWQMQSFSITTFHELIDTNLKDTVSELRKISLPIEPEENIFETFADIRNGS